MAFRPPAFLTYWVVVLFIYMKTLGWRAGVRRLSSTLQLTSLLPAPHSASTLPCDAMIWIFISFYTCIYLFSALDYALLGRRACKIFIMQ